MVHVAKQLSSLDVVAGPRNHVINNKIGLGVCGRVRVGSTSTGVIRDEVAVDLI